jgi:signal transduction histidine kinase
VNEPSITPAELRAVDLFDDLDDAELAEWVEISQPLRVTAGGTITEQGEVPLGMYLLLAGQARAVMINGDHSDPLALQHAPTWMGAIAVLTDSPLGVRMRAETDCRLALIEAEGFRRLAGRQESVNHRVMQQIQPVMSRLTEVEQSRERLAALGTMAAGLAHELNNPAAAARRAAAQMTEALSAIDSALGSFVDAGVERAEAAQLVLLQREALGHAAACSALDALDAADAEEALIARMEALGVEEAWRLAEPLALASAEPGWLERVIELAGPAAGAALRWIAASITAERLAAEIVESTERMSTLVGAVKSYAYMDRGELVEVDLHEGLETTLTVLNHKLKHTEIEVVRHYDRTLPLLTVRGSELNQVWTNLIDNAIEALGEKGTLTITTQRDGAGCVVVEIADDGPGIPPEILGKILDPFFTTKEVGRGTGLGLATARRIVVDRHDGSLTIDSKPGATTFRVRLPIKQG